MPGSFVPLFCITMVYQELIPCSSLVPYVKCYFIYQSNSNAAFSDTVLPSGCMEIIFNLGNGNWHQLTADGYVATPPVELWGQLSKPLAIKSTGQNIMLGIRFYPHAAAFFVNDKIDIFNNQVVDFTKVGGNNIQTLHNKLLDTLTWEARLQMIETFLLQTFCNTRKKVSKIAVVNDVMHELKQDDFFDNIDNVPNRYGITSRYLQKLFLQYTGLTPKLYSKINRFQNSLKLLNNRDASLTSIAYDCGYFDQSHFIREFKSFTGCTPSSYSFNSSPITQAFVNN